MSKLTGILILIFSFLSGFVAAQDSLKKVSFKIQGEFWGTFVNHPYNPGINRPIYLDINSFNSRDTVKDTPLKHGAYYAAVKTTTSFTPGLKLSFNLYGEHRGISYGMYDRNNIVVYPLFLLEVKDSVNFLKRKLIIEARVGDLLDTKLDEGLFIYNVDAQGGETTISSGRMKASFAWYGDFYRGIGLNIDDVYRLSLNRNFGKQNNSTAGIGIYALPPPLAQPLDHLYYTAYFRHRYGKGDIYAQAGFQSGSDKGSFYSRGLKEQSAIVIGTNFLYAKRKWFGQALAEVRYYGSSLNVLHNDNNVRYRDPGADLYANTTGEYLYPLRKYDNPFSQWAVYTEYAVCDVLGISLAGNINYKLSRKTTATLDFDLNYISAVENADYSSSENTSTVFYPFFTLGYYYTPINNCKIGIVLTNRGMNLNIGYPTLFQFTRPYAGFKIRCAI